MRRLSHPAVRRFEIVLVVVCAAGLPLALWWPRTLQGKFYATLSLPIVALAIALFATWMRKRRDTTDLPLRSLDLETWAAASERNAAIDTSRWSVELLKRVEWRRFESLLAAYFEALEFRVEPVRPTAPFSMKLYSGKETSP